MEIITTTAGEVPLFSAETRSLFGPPTRKRRRVEETATPQLFSWPILDSWLLLSGKKILGARIKKSEGLYVMPRAALTAEAFIGAYSRELVAAAAITPEYDGNRVLHLTMAMVRYAILLTAPNDIEPGISKTDVWSGSVGTTALPTTQIWHWRLLSERSITEGSDIFVRKKLDDRDNFVKKRILSKTAARYDPKDGASIYLKKYLRQPSDNGDSVNGLFLSFQADYSRNVEDKLDAVNGIRGWLSTLQSTYPRSDGVPLTVEEWFYWFITRLNPQLKEMQQIAPAVNDLNSVITIKILHQLFKWLRSLPLSSLEEIVKAPLPSSTVFIDEAASVSMNLFISMSKKPAFMKWVDFLINHYKKLASGNRNRLDQEEFPVIEEKLIEVIQEFTPLLDINLPRIRQTIETTLMSLKNALKESNIRAALILPYSAIDVVLDGDEAFLDNAVRLLRASIQMRLYQRFRNGGAEIRTIINTATDVDAADKNWSLLLLDTMIDAQSNFKEQKEDQRIKEFEKIEGAQLLKKLDTEMLEIQTKSVQTVYKQSEGSIKKMVEELSLLKKSIQEVEKRFDEVKAKKSIREILLLNGARLLKQNAIQYEIKTEFHIEALKKLLSFVSSNKNVSGIPAPEKIQERIKKAEEEKTTTVETILAKARREFESANGLHNKVLESKFIAAAGEIIDENEESLRRLYSMLPTIEKETFCTIMITRFGRNDNIPELLPAICELMWLYIVDLGAPTYVDMIAALDTAYSDSLKKQPQFKRRSEYELQLRRASNNRLLRWIRENDRAIPNLEELLREAPVVADVELYKESSRRIDPDVSITIDYDAIGSNILEAPAYITRVFPREFGENVAPDWLERQNAVALLVLNENNDVERLRNYIALFLGSLKKIVSPENNERAAFIASITENVNLFYSTDSDIETWFRTVFIEEVEGKSISGKSISSPPRTAANDVIDDLGILIDQLKILSRVRTKALVDAQKTAVLKLDLLSERTDIQLRNAAEIMLLDAKQFAAAVGVTATRFKAPKIQRGIFFDKEPLKPLFYFEDEDVITCVTVKRGFSPEITTPQDIFQLPPSIVVQPTVETIVLSTISSIEKDETERMSYIEALENRLDYTNFIRNTVFRNIKLLVAGLLNYVYVSPHSLLSLSTEPSENVSASEGNPRPVHTFAINDGANVVADALNQLNGGADSDFGQQFGSSLKERYWGCMPYPIHNSPLIFRLAAPITENRDDLETFTHPMLLIPGVGGASRTATNTENIFTIYAVYYNLLTKAAQSPPEIMKAALLFAYVMNNIGTGVSRLPSVDRNILGDAAALFMIGGRFAWPRQISDDSGPFSSHDLFSPILLPNHSFNTNNLQLIPTIQQLYTTLTGMEESTQKIEEIIDKAKFDRIRNPNWQKLFYEESQNSIFVDSYVEFLTK